jgi:hypothetical protein
VGALLSRGHPEVVDADLADYFGSIPHAELLTSVARRIVDRRVLHLIKMWLECAVEETDERGRKTRTTRGPRQPARHSARVTHLTAAGKSVHAPVRAGMELGPERRLGSRIVTYADDRVILCRNHPARFVRPSTCTGGTLVGSRNLPRSRRRQDRARLRRGGTTPRRAWRRCRRGGSSVDDRLSTASARRRRQGHNRHRSSALAATDRSG